MKQVNRKWRSGFIVLLALILAEIVGLVMLVSSLVGPTDNVKFPNEKLSENRPIFTISADKQRLETLINSEIKKRNSTDSVAISMQLKKSVELHGKLNVFFTQVPFKMTFAPRVKDGNIILTQKSVTLGRVSLPVDEVLEFVKAGANLPDWVIVAPDKEQIYIKLSDLVFKDRFYLQAKEVDLKHNNIKFNVFEK